VIEDEGVGHGVLLPVDPSPERWRIEPKSA